MRSNSAISLAFVGDVTVGDEFVAHVQIHGMDFLYPFQSVQTPLMNADIVLANLEGPIFTGDKKRNDVSAILSNHPSILKLFKNFSISVLNLANNHIMDYGPEGLRHTLKLLERNGIYHIGAGKNLSEANRELIIEHKGKHIAFLGFTTNEHHVNAVLAGPNREGCASYLDLDRIAGKIRQLKSNVDVICISLHWGHEYYLYPSHEQLNIGHFLAEAGADYVIGHHPHCVQGIEKYNGALIFYSLGNFFMPPLRTISGRIQLKKDISNVFIIIKSKVIGSENLDFEIIGGKMGKDYNLIPFDDDRQKEFDVKIKNLSKPIYRKNYKKFWPKYKAIRIKELTRESLIEAFRKLSNISLKELFKTIKLEDLKRNLIRLYKAISS